ncbi:MULTISPECIES: carbohydrate-binding protein [unclassified Enterococcus]|uniref:carbohydrate-binding protein n=1 Tax=unclassified Enterococcus TaxID=2608891 RepID=UPI001CE05E14|nr:MULTISPECIES: carbohydrate-binding protein [unclassified Enterococcus]MCA5013309.1 trypsin-like serine protease [Enterococcus sp. S23]MCA5016559.1 trypsin-like serine protease [Enterococcus sp. S22(2020)]
MKLKKLSMLLLCGMILSTTSLTTVSHAEENQPSSRKIIGTDDRVKINDTTQTPYSSIVYVRVGNSTGSGTVIGKNKILTAAHVAEDLTSSEVISKSYVTPARNGKIKPYGSFDVESAEIHPIYAASRKRENDIAVITVKPNSENQTIGDVVPVVPVNNVPTVSIGSTSVLPGYGGDKKGELWEGRGKILSQSSLRFHYDTDTVGGNSGGPVFNENFDLLGVHTTGSSTSNSATKLTGSNYELVEKHLDKGNPDTQAPSQVTGVKASEVTKNSVKLSWDTATDNIGVDRYEIYRNGSKISESRTTSQTVTNLAANTSYDFSIVAVDAAGNRSVASKPITVKTLEDKPGEPSENETTWEIDKTYDTGDRVFYEGLEYEAKWWTRGTRPDESDVWLLLSDQAVEWNAKKGYDGGAKVTFKGKTYQAKHWTKGEQPGTSNVWVII